MATSPEFPHNVPTDQRQVDGDQKTEDLHSTHRGNMALIKKASTYEGFKRSVKPRGPLRYYEEG